MTFAGAFIGGIVLGVICKAISVHRKWSKETHMKFTILAGVVYTIMLFFAFEGGVQ